MIEIDFEKEIFVYGDKIELKHRIAEKFKPEENWVILECVDRLLEKGYNPGNIILENTWKAGHGHSGRLDILVKRDDRSSYLMIECKTWDDKYLKEIKEMKKNGGQLLSYYQQDKSAKYLCLYTSTIKDNSISYENSIIKTDESWNALNSKDDVFDFWNKKFKENGIFEEDIHPYDIKIKSLIRENLKKMGEDDSRRIFDQFSTILRYNAVSDKSNAFNKLFNLFLCKILDEDRGHQTEVEFQWKADDNYRSFLRRLQKLYKEGVKQYLNIKMIDYDEDEFEIKGMQNKDKIIDLFTNSSIRNTPEFSFIEVYDKKSFAQNAQIVREVVELFQPYKIRYKEKHQFLGDFFELLLNTSMKQESGQFFTPIPIVQFIISSFPIKGFILDKISKNKTNELLPFVIDYASGSGHFLTEVMNVLHEYILKINRDEDLSIMSESIKDKLTSWKTDSFSWAENYIYGIDADYRLVKTSKVNCYLNGDGMANIIHGNGLDNFSESTDYTGLLKLDNKELQKDNPKFDLLISNPPFSVSGFTNTLNRGDKSFDIFKYLSPKSGEIETLFVERAKQLLKDGSYAAIILPKSFLRHSAKTYIRAREIILEYFLVHSIVDLGKETFMEANVETVILFLKRRNVGINIKENIDIFFDSFVDNTVFGIESAFSQYVYHISDELSLDDYISLIRCNPNIQMLKSSFYKEAGNKFGGNFFIKKNTEFLKQEKEKMYYFFLTYNQRTLIVEVDKNIKKNRAFKGYKINKGRGKEGIEMLKDENGECTSKFYNIKDLLDYNDTSKVNHYIYNTFLADDYVKEQEIDESLKDNLYYRKLSEMIDFRPAKDFIKQIYLKKKINFNSIWSSSLPDVVHLKSIHEIGIIEKGTSITERDVKQGNVPVVAGGKKPAYYHHKSNRDKGIITISASGNAGLLNYWDVPIFASDCITIRSRNEGIISTKILYLFLKSIQDVFFSLQSGMAQKHIYIKDFADIKIPVLSKSAQDRIVFEVESLEKDIEKKRESVWELNSEIKYRYDAYKKLPSTSYFLSDGLHFNVFIGKRVLKKDMLDELTYQRAEGSFLPVYSASINPSGFIRKQDFNSLLEDFNESSILWTIDADWDVHVLDKDVPFYATDHCGVIRTKTENLSTQYIAMQLKEIGIAEKFDRTIRASKSEIKKIKIDLPCIEKQQEFELFMLHTKKRIKEIEKEIDGIVRAKENILNIYFN